jgi:membrane fusion protein, multidrug efflux system
MTPRIASLTAALLIAALPARAAQPVAPQQPPLVRTVNPTLAAASQSYEIPGRTEPMEEVQIFTRATGIVGERRFDIGDSVKKGDILAVIEVPDLDGSVDAAKAAVTEAAAKAANASAEAARSSELLKTHAISQETADSRASDALQASAALDAARANLARLTAQQSFATVRAPFDGVIAARNFGSGDRVRGDSATADGWLYQLVKLDTLRFVVQAAPDLAMCVGPGTKAAVSFAEFPGKTFAASVARSSKVFDPTTGTMRVELLLNNADLTLPAGLTGTARFDLAPQPGTFLVPTNTILLRAGISFLAIVRDGKMQLMQVRSGRNLGALIEVASEALDANTAVLVNPNAMLKPGDAVQIGEKE